jgi:hypothetical protein
MPLRGFPEGAGGNAQAQGCRISGSEAAPGRSATIIGMAMTEARAQQPSSLGQAIAGWPWRGFIERYGIAVIGIALALGLRTALASVFEGAATCNANSIDRPSRERRLTPSVTCAQNSIPAGNG